ncbi:hypothetical protein T492DRAFT_954145 [Pavlovales sp. CCMP2436]|nr:hypothetical protein T492DRAFT_954145 [Pavlovales sp. CCMP2436]
MEVDVPEEDDPAAGITLPPPCPEALNVVEVAFARAEGTEDEWVYVTHVRAFPGAVPEDEHGGGTLARTQPAVLCLTYRGGKLFAFARRFSDAASSDYLWPDTAAEGVAQTMIPPEETTWLAAVGIVRDVLDDPELLPIITNVNLTNTRLGIKPEEEFEYAPLQLQDLAGAKILFTRAKRIWLAAFLSAKLGVVFVHSDMRALLDQAKAPLI